MEPKRQKLETLVINPQVLETKEELRATIADSQPYKYGVIQSLIDDKVLRNARDEIMKNISFTEKETDIYKVNQTGDLANLQRLPGAERELLQNLCKVRDGLYSPEFREFMSYTTGCGPLSGSKQDLSINMYSKGCHLLNHDDVIGTRRVSYILYLTPPDEPWQAKWGGGLRLFPTVKPGVPETDFSVVIPPQWNQMAYFKVQPGHSFHDVQEVYADKERLSISGWFHAPQEGEPGYTDEKDEDLDKATLAQLEQLEQSEEFEPKLDLQPLNAETESELDTEYLQKFVQPSILESLEDLNEKFASDSMLQISNFLNNDYFKVLSEAIEVDDLEKVPQTVEQMPQPWKVATPSHIHRYMYLDGETTAPASKTNAAHTKLEELRQFFSSRQFAQLLRKITGLGIESSQAIARRFRPGCDFTLATASKVTMLEATLSVTTSKWDESFGGYDLIMAPDEEDQGADAAVYRSGGDSTVLSTVFPAANELTLVYREEGLLRFIKYVSNSANGSRWDINACYGLEEGDDEDESEDEGESKGESDE